MLTLIHKTKFYKDLKRMFKCGEDPEKIKRILQYLMNKEIVEAKYRDHALIGNYMDCRECHIEPDCFVIYLIQEDTINFIKTGSHADLFK